MYRIALDIERELLKSLAEKEPTFAEISLQLSESVHPHPNT
jgi:GTP cyclohydrolase FolE2